MPKHPLALIAAVTLLTIGGVVAARLYSPQPARPPGVGASMDALHDAEPGWRFYPTSGKGLRDGYYCVADGRPVPGPADFSSFGRGEFDAGRWRGILSVTPYAPGGEFEPGGHVARVGDLMLYGDPELVGRAADILRRGS